MTGHNLLIDQFEVGEYITPHHTRGVYYAPYNKMTCIFKGDMTVVALVGGHQQYWSNQAHYIPAHVTVFRKFEDVRPGVWLVENVYEKPTGHQSKKVQADAIAYAREIENGRQI